MATSEYQRNGARYCIHNLTVCPHCDDNQPKTCHHGLTDCPICAEALANYVEPRTYHEFGDSSHAVDRYGNVVPISAMSDADANIEAGWNYLNSPSTEQIALAEANGRLHPHVNTSDLIHKKTAPSARQRLGPTTKEYDEIEKVGKESK